MNYSCAICGVEFEAKHKTGVCPNCRVGKCVVCGSEFKRIAPFTQMTCSPKCRGILRKESGQGKVVAAKASKTMESRYGVSNSAAVSGPKKEKVCPICGDTFMPETFRQVYCKKDHYGPCPVCGKPTLIKDYNIGPQCCSEECRISRIKSTCLDKYGDICVLNSDYGLEKRRNTCLEKYGVEHCSQTDEWKQKFKYIMRERYGVDSPLQNPEILAKVQETNVKRYGGISPTCNPEVVEKSRITHELRYGGVGLASPEIATRIYKTCYVRYGVSNPTSCPTIQDKRRLTVLNRYGGNAPLCDPKIRVKHDKTMIDRYGVAFITQDPQRCKEIQTKSAMTMLRRYGVLNPSHSKEFLNKARNTFIQRYGVPWYVLTKDCSDANRHTKTSKINVSFSSLLQQRGLCPELEFYLGGKSYDVRVDDVLFELNPTITHNAHTSLFRGGKPLGAEYHIVKTHIARENGYRCVHIFDWDDVNGIISLFVPQQKIYARKCEVRSVDEITANRFMERNHLFGACRGQMLNYGLYHNGELVMLMTFGTPRVSDLHDYELLRFCSKRGLRVCGGASKLFSHFARCNPGASVVSYCDLSKFTGDVYLAIGMSLKEIIPPMKIWSKEHMYVTNDLLKASGFVKLFGANEVADVDVSDEQLMLNSGWLPVYDCGCAVYEYGV